MDCYFNLFLLKKTAEKIKLEMCFLCARVWAPKPVYRSPERPEYVTESKPSEYLVCLYSNNLYGFAISQPLPTADFTWMENVDELDVSAVSTGNYREYILEVDLGKFIFNMVIINYKK